MTSPNRYTPPLATPLFTGPAVPRLEETCRADDVAEGDLIFATRDFWIQRLSDLAGDPWVHLGIAAEVDGKLSIIEVGPTGCGSRPLEDITGVYRMMGVGRLPMAHLDCGCYSGVVDWSKDQIGRPITYAWDHFNLAGFGALFSRWLSPFGHPDEILAGPAEAIVSRYRRAGIRRFCSSFIAAALEHCCRECRLDFTPFTVGSTIAEAEQGRIRREFSDEAKRIFATPSDIWRARNLERSVLLDCANGRSARVAQAPSAHNDCA